MDNGKGRFEMINESKARELIENDYPLGIFRVGEIIELKGSRFRIKSVKLKELRLKLLPSMGSQET